MFRIRMATVGDTAEIVAVWEEAVRATHGFLTDDEIAYYKNLLPEYFGEVELYVCEDGGQIKGFSGIAGDKLEMLFVADRGAGTGTRLTEHAIGKGVRRVDVNEENGPAARFYVARGFVQTGRSATDGEGKPHPILHLELSREK